MLRYNRHIKIVGVVELLVGVGDVDGCFQSRSSITKTTRVPQATIRSYLQ